MARSAAERDETLDGLFGGRLLILQRKRGYRLSLDAVLLARFVALRGTERIIDLGAGSGVVALSLAFLNPSVKVVGLELQRPMVDRAVRSARLNHLEGRVEFFRGDVRSVDRHFAAGSFDVAVSNPPYRRPRSGRVNPDPERLIARHEIQGSLADFLLGGSYLLRHGGKMVLVYPAARAADLLVGMREAGVEPKRLRFVHSSREAPASLVLAEGIKGARSDLRIMAPLVIYAERNRHTEEMKAIVKI